MATIKGKWQFTNDAMRIKDHPVHYCEQGVDFTAASTTQCTSITFDYSEADLTVNILFYIPEIVMSHFIVNPSTGAIADAAYAQVDFGNTPQEVSDDFLDLMNLVAVPTNDDGTVTLNGKYVVSPAGVGKIWTYGALNANYIGPPTVYYIEYTNTKGILEDQLSYFRESSLPSDGKLYFGYGSVSDPGVTTNGFVMGGDSFQIIDFGQQNQTIDAIFYGEVLRYALVPIKDNQYVDTAGLATIVDKVTTRYESDILFAANASLPKMRTIKAYGTSAVTDTGKFDTDANVLFLCVTPAASSTQIFLTVPIDNLALNSGLQVSAPDNTRTTYFQIWRYTDEQLQVTAKDCYNDSAATQSTTGKINAIYGMKIGG